ncbi:hypothetical protein CEXT_613701 [Caerostris extrusa]|uniref:Uncharacterized protein n=1 Tax=Caerostris extrusa TaxID=172846 RepID=A0AAV4XWY8_CAEEX|nr:hypothetical protein CEXT_613701 [Caerostris extrusa]
MRRQSERDPFATTCLRILVLRWGEKSTLPVSFVYLAECRSEFGEGLLRIRVCKLDYFSSMDDVVRKEIASLELSMKHKESRGIIEGIHDGYPSEAEYIQKHPFCIPKVKRTTIFITFKQNFIPQKRIHIIYIVAEKDCLTRLRNAIQSGLEMLSSSSKWYCMRLGYVWMKERFAEDVVRKEIVKASILHPKGKASKIDAFSMTALLVPTWARGCTQGAERKKEEITNRTNKNCLWKPDLLLLLCFLFFFSVAVPSESIVCEKQLG